MIAGPNGSGKSTLTNALMAAPGVDLPSHYINADELQRRQRIADVAVAQRKASEARRKAQAKGRDFMYETVMSHPSKLAELQLAREAGYHVTIHFVSTRHADINVERVALRVAAGGHPVPEERVRQRHARTMALAPSALGYADDALVFDNSRRGREGGLQLQAHLVEGELVLCSAEPADWVAALATAVHDRATELSRLHKHAKEAGLPLMLARLDGGMSIGPLERMGQHHVLQFDLQSRVLLAHDRALLPAETELHEGRSYRLGYLEGVSSIEAIDAA
jgi:predicted ABC-type ATPase